MYSDSITVEAKKKDNINYYKQELPGIDPGVIELVKLMNKLPGIAVESSCSGHPERDNTRVFISFLATREGYDAFCPVFEVMCSTITSFPTTLIGRKGSILASMAIPNNTYSKSIGNPLRWCHYISIAFKTEEGQAKVIETMEKVLTITLEGYPQSPA